MNGEQLNLKRGIIGELRPATAAVSHIMKRQTAAAQHQKTDQDDQAVDAEWLQTVSVGLRQHVSLAVLHDRQT